MDSPLIPEECICHCSCFNNHEYCILIDIVLSKSEIKRQVGNHYI